MKKGLMRMGTRYARGIPPSEEEGTENTIPIYPRVHQGRLPTLHTALRLRLPNYFLALKIASLAPLAARNLSTVFVGILILGS
jgi:hypothetical protein